MLMNALSMPHSDLLLDVPLGDIMKEVHVNELIGEK
jgi:hypothetical protein